VRALTPSERRGALIVVVLLVLGAARDLVVARLAPRTAAPRIQAAEVPPPAAPAPDPGRAPDAGRTPATPVVDLNRANARELDALPGIGPVLAGRILDHRRRAGPFRSVDELRAVRGVGPRLLERVRPRVTVSPAAPGSEVRERVQSARERPPGAADSAQVRGRAFR
jgi:competence protein ComEA